MLDVVQKSVNPVLYWIIVGMWLFMGGWTLFFSPVSYWQTARFLSEGPRIYLEGKTKESSGMINDIVSKAFAESKNNITFIVASEKSRNIHPVSKLRSVIKIDIQQAPEKYLVRSKRFGAVVSVPKKWSVSKKADAESETIDMKAPGGQAHISLICMDMKMDVSIKAFVSYMQEQLKQEIPFIRIKDSKKIIDEKGFAKSGLNSELFEYQGKYDGYNVKALTCYIVHGKLGYVVIGLYQSSNLHMQKLIRLTVDSIVIKKIKGNSNAK